MLDETQFMRALNNIAIIIWIIVIIACIPLHKETHIQGFKSYLIYSLSFFHFLPATTSISTKAFFGKVFTATAERAG